MTSITFRRSCVLSLPLTVVLAFAACGSGGGSNPAPVAPVVDVAGHWGGAYATATSTGSIAFDLQQQGDRVTGTCHLQNKVQMRSVDFTLTVGRATATGFTFTMDEVAPAVGRFTGTAQRSGATELEMSFSGQDPTGPISAQAVVTSVRANGTWIGYWQSPLLPLVPFALRLEQAGGNVAGTMFSFQSAVGLPTVFQVAGDVAGDAMRLVLTSNSQLQPQARIEVLGRLDGESVDLSWSGNDGIVTHAGGTGLAQRTSPFRASTATSSGLYAGMIGSTEWQGFAVMDLVQFRGTEYGAQFWTERRGLPEQCVGSVSTLQFAVPMRVLSTTPGCAGLFDLRLEPRTTTAGGASLHVTFTGQDCAGTYTNGQWDPIRM